eukprot:m.118778 g.118778  ORF g.118778 m.118778 type:complete len:59 (-) comp23141_c1_seq3:85-261(-)
MTFAEKKKEPGGGVFFLADDDSIPVNDSVNPLLGGMFTLPLPGTFCYCFLMIDGDAVV